MTNFIPIFPLAIVVYPGESLNLHIFEERYKQLINECFAQKKPFGIPSVVSNKVCEMGTLVEITAIAKTYDDGKMDIKTKGISVFRTLETIKEIPAKLYSGAIVSYPQNSDAASSALLSIVTNNLKELHRLLKIKKEFAKPENELLSYDMAHHAGLSLEEEYELLTLLREDQRLEYLKRHLNKILPVVASTENLKEKIKLNGHFKEVKGFNPDV